MLFVRIAAGVIAIVSVFVVSAGSSGPRPVDAASNCWALQLEVDAEEVSFFLLLNQYRAQHGLRPLALSTNLTRAASWHAYDMGTQNYFDHTNRAGQGPQERAIGCGYTHPAGENLAAGTNWTTGKHAFEAWKDSAGHRANMLHAGYVQVGIARYYAPGSKYGWYWATSFGTAYDGTDGTEMRVAGSGILSAGLNPRGWNVATVLPGGVRVSDIQGYTAWHPLANGWWQQWGPEDYIPGGWQVGLLPIGMSMDKGRNPR